MALCILLSSQKFKSGVSGVMKCSSYNIYMCNCANLILDLVSFSFILLKI